MPGGDKHEAGPFPGVELGERLAFRTRTWEGSRMGMGFKVGKLEVMSVDSEEFQELNPEMIHCFKIIRGWGDTGRRAKGMKKELRRKNTTQQCSRGQAEDKGFRRKRRSVLQVAIKKDKRRIAKRT